MMSEAKYENFNYDLALRYLVVAAGRSHVEEIGLGRVAPRWLGSRPDLITVGGESITENEKWSKTVPLTDLQKRSVVSRVVELAVIVCMNSHVYSFGQDLFVQQSGGPIGMRFTAALASIVMKMWDLWWEKLMEREGLWWDLYVRYVDDCRLFLPSISKGWFWNGTKFSFSREREEEDIAIGLSDEQRTTKIISEAMCSLVEFLKFTGEDSSMFDDNTLPTLDTALWVSEGQVKYKFYEKPTCSNQVVHRDTALPRSSIESTLIQETVRRLKNSSANLDSKERTAILTKFSNKMINSGHGARETRGVIVRGD